MSSSAQRAISIRLPPVSSEMRARATALRRTMTDAERRLWTAIRLSDLPFRIQRQRVIGPYICDFASLEAGLVIELDGSQHLTAEGAAKDRARDEYLQGLGFTVLRFSDIDVLKNAEGVMEEIVREAEWRIGRRSQGRPE